MLWIILTLFYGIVKGAREIVKKKSFEKSTLMEVLFFYTLIGFLMLLPDIGNVSGLTPELYGLVALKSFIIFVAWLCGFKAVKEIPVSVYGVLDLSRVLFSTLLGIFVLHETMRGNQVLGLFLVAAGLVALRFEKNWRKRREAKKASAAGLPVSADEQTPEQVEKEKSNPVLFTAMAFLSALLNAMSGTMDKILTKEVTSAQLQFWYMLFLLLMYAAYILVTRTKLDLKRAVKNEWIWVLSALFIVADRALFVANGIPDSRVTVMTLLKQSGCIVTIVAGKLVFKEKGIGYKLCCAAVIIAGIMVGAI
ncbi:MAG: DMT family transporter [Lachnospiraceae bacterium]|nr:DMT family transporter [Lachnospiraceae bacterium]